MDCPSFDELLDAFESEDRGASYLARLDTMCPECARRVELVRSLVRSLDSGPFPDVPQHLHDAAVSIGEAPVPNGTPVPAGVHNGHSSSSAPPGGRERSGWFAPVREFIADLVFDSFLHEPVAVLRGRSATERHLLYRAGSFEVDLALTESGAIVGQVLGDDDEWENVRDATCILTGEDRTWTSDIESNGDFHFDGVGPGSYVLQLEAPEVRLVVPEFEFSSAVSDDSGEGFSI